MRFPIVILFAALALPLSATEPVYRDIGGERVAIYFDDPDLKDAEDAIERALLDMNQWLDKREQQREIFDVFQKEGVREEILGNIAKRLGIASVSDKERKLYDNACANARRVVGPAPRPQRVFVYELSSTLQAAKDGKPPRYLKLNTDGSINFNWTSAAAAAAGEPLDPPIGLILQKDPKLAYGAQVTAGFFKYRQLFDEFSMQVYGRRAYTTINDVTHAILASAYPEIPAWFHQGAVTWTTIFVTSDLIGKENVQPAFYVIHPRYPNDRSYTLDDLYAWSTPDGSILHPNLVRTAADIVMKAEQAKPGATAAVLRFLASKKKAKIPAKDILPAYRKAVKLDLSEIATKALAQAAK